MTVQELHYDFDVKFDRVSSLSKPDFLPAEKDWLLNEAQSMLIKQKYNNKLNPGFETSQKRIDDLKSLVVKFPAQAPLSPTRVSSDLYTLSLSDLAFPYLFYISGKAKLVDPRNNCSSTAILRFIPHDDLYRSLKDPWNKTNSSSIIFNFASSPTPNQDAIYLYSGDFEIESVYIDYIRHPLRINLGTYEYIDGIIYPPQSSELPEHTHNEVVDLAVFLASSITESPEMIPNKAQILGINE